MYYVFDSLYLTLACFSQDNIARTKNSPTEKYFCSQISVCIILNKSFKIHQNLLESLGKNGTTPVIIMVTNSRFLPHKRKCVIQYGHVARYENKCKHHHCPTMENVDRNIHSL